LRLMTRTPLYSQNENNLSRTWSLRCTRSATGCTTHTSRIASGAGQAFGLRVEHGRSTFLTVCTQRRRRLLVLLSSFQYNDLRLGEVVGNHDFRGANMGPQRSSFPTPRACIDRLLHGACRAQLLAESSLQKKIGGYVEDLCKLLRLRLANRPLSAHNLRGYAARAEYVEKIALAQTVLFHQTAQPAVRR
jgi:hypothetical protein